MMTHRFLQSCIVAVGLVTVVTAVPEAAAQATNNWYFQGRVAPTGKYMHPVQTFGPFATETQATAAARNWKSYGWVIVRWPYQKGGTTAPSLPQYDMIMGYKVPRTFKDDGASVPISGPYWAKLWALGIRTALNVKYPAVWRLHDYLYAGEGIRAYPNLSRLQVDQLMLQHLLNQGCPRQVANIIYDAVRKYGQSHTARR